MRQKVNTCNMCMVRPPLPSGGHLTSSHLIISISIIMMHSGCACMDTGKALMAWCGLAWQCMPTACMLRGCEGGMAWHGTRAGGVGIRCDVGEAAPSLAASQPASQPTGSAPCHFYEI